MTNIFYPIFKFLIKLIIEFALFPFLLLTCLLKRFYKTKVIGIGPLPLINNIYHKRALEVQGWKALTFVDEVFFISNKFDVRLDLKFSYMPFFLKSFFSFIWTILHFDCLYFYFDGLSLRNSILLSKLEPYFLKLAGIKSVLLAYGSDVQSMSTSPNLIFKHAVSLDYPTQGRKDKKIAQSISRWMNNSSHVLAGCEWVDYLPGWDTLQIAHFSIDTQQWKYSFLKWGGPDLGPLKILHAPNHRSIKGTSFILHAISELKREGLNIELILLEKVPNHKIMEVMKDCHLVIDQLIIGWYAMFAIESMSMGKPVLCYLREDLLNLYEFAGLLKKNNFPLINTSHSSIKEQIKTLYFNNNLLEEHAVLGRKYVEENHSIESIGRVFNEVNIKIGLVKREST